MMQNMYSVCSLSGFPIMHNVCNEVVSRVLLCNLSFFCQVLTKVHIPINTNSMGAILISKMHFVVSSVRWLTNIGNTYVIGKLTMVGFFSTKKLFLVNLLMQKMRYGGSLVNWNLLRKFSL